MRHLTVDGMMSGTGIRDSIAGGYFRLSDLGLSPPLASRISEWVRAYAEAHLDGYRDRERVAILDEEGMKICAAIRDEVPASKVEYYSDALMRRHLV
jgi:hypothetical protein